MKIRINELQQALNKILEAIKQRNGETFEVDVEEDYYYHIPTDGIYKIGDIPTNLTIGSLADDIEEMKKISEGENYPTSTNLNKLNSILRYLGDNLI